MNTKDVQKNQVQEEISSLSSDKLEQIFAGQKMLMKDYKPIAESHYEKVFGTPVKINEVSWEGGEHNLHSKSGNFLIKDMLDATIQELAEAVQVLKNWKAWKQTEMASDSEHFKEELVDALHFYVEACIFSGISAQELYDLYFKKHAVNQFRQRSNY